MKSSKIHVKMKAFEFRKFRLCAILRSLHYTLYTKSFATLRLLIEHVNCICMCVCFLLVQHTFISKTGENLMKTTKRIKYQTIKPSISLCECSMHLLIKNMCMWFFLGGGKKVAIVNCYFQLKRKAASAFSVVFFLFSSSFLLLEFLMSAICYNCRILSKRRNKNM